MKGSLSEEDCHEYSSLVVADIFEHAAAVGAQVPVKESYWRDLGINDRESVYLCSWMSGKGMVQLPQNRGVISDIISIILYIPPRTLALTQKSWELQIEDKKERTIVTNIGILGDGNYVGENLNVGGWQNNAGEVSGENSLTASDVLKLVEALRVDGSEVPGLEGAHIQATAEFLEKEIKNGVSLDTMGDTLGEVVAQVSKIAERGAEFMGATISVLKVLGLM